MPELHPIVRQLQPSEEQIPPIAARGSDVLVTAGAGTGKTRTLVARYLSLLAEGLHPNEIAAITFTRKAAREMRNRVRQAISDYLHGEILSRQERQLWAERYAQLDSARIGTIHSLCTEILRAHPAEAGVDPLFSVLEEAESAILRSRAVNDALAWASDDDEAVILFTTFSEAGLRALLDLLLAARLEAALALARQPEAVLDEWQRVLRRRQERALGALLARDTWRQAARTVRHNAATRPDDNLEIQRQLALSALDAAQEAGEWPSMREALSGLDQIDLRGGSKYAWPGGKEQQAEIKDALRDLRTLWRERAGFLSLELNEADRALARALPGLKALFQRVAAGYRRLRNERHALDFDDLESKALALLRENTAIVGRWRTEVRIVLVDEYQDTNARQRNLVNLLTAEEGRLFIVGDAKQSIYRFRGADVTVFRQERRRIAGQGASYALETSYRAHAALIKALNDLLRPVLGSEEDSAAPWREPFRPLRPYRRAPAGEISPPFLELHLAVGSKARGALERAAAALAARVVDLVENPEANVTYADVAILCRSSNSFAAYEDALDRAGAPYVTVAGRGFYERAEVRDLLNALQVVADPTADLPLAGFLRSPIMGLSDSELLHLVWQWQESGGASLWDSLLGLRAAEGATATGRVVPTVKHLHQLAGRSTIAGTLKKLLDETGYRAALKQAGQMRALRNVGKLVEVAQASGIVDAAEFLDYVSTVRDVAVREGEARSPGEDALQIMSVHQAKGLEFPVVVIGDANYQHRGTPGAILDPELGLTTGLNLDDAETPAVLEMARRREADQEAAESDRLLYVAATRAREVLIFSGTINLDRNGRPSRLGGWLNEVAHVTGLSRQTIDDYRVDGDRALDVPLAPGVTFARCVVYEPEQGTPPASAPAPSTETRAATDLDPGNLIRPLPAVRPDEVAPRDPSWYPPGAAGDRHRRQRLIGSLVHEAIAAGLLVRESDGPALESWATARARTREPAGPAWLSQAVQQALLLLHRLREHEFWRQIAGAERRLHEIPYVVEHGIGYDSGRIDLLYLRQGRWSIVDFKTDPVRSPAQLQELMRNEFRPQLARYRRAVSALFKVQPHCAICLLDYRNKVHVEPV